MSRCYECAEIDGYCTCRTTTPPAGVSSASTTCQRCGDGVSIQWENDSTFAVATIVAWSRQHDETCPPTATAEPGP